VGGRRLRAGGGRGPAALALAALVAASRVYLGVHWATDVLAAAALGAAWTLAVITAHLPRRARRQEPSRS
jgi:undecaprenyl-diphosphatase